MEAAGVRKCKCRVSVTAAAAVILLGGILAIWSYSVEEDVHFTPDYPMEDITPYLDKGMLTGEEYETLYQQTGLSRLAVDCLREQNRSEELLAVQERFFAEVKTSCEWSWFIFRETLRQQENSEEAQVAASAQPKDDTGMFPELEDGDILITFNSHFFGWRNGHAAIVVDAEAGRTLEALMLGRDSAILSVDDWMDRPSFAVLRLSGASKEERAQIAEYAERELVQLPYRLSAGIWEAEAYDAGEYDAGACDTGECNTEACDTRAYETRAECAETDGGAAELSGTQCAHLIWYAYEQFGYDLDSDGGLLVTPRDLYESPLLEVVQIYGMDPRENKE